MGELTAGEARMKISMYNSDIEDIIYQVQKNFGDMDFSNANRKDEMEEIINQIKRDCESVKSEMNSLSFEE